ncbi:hypothetical protein GVAV_001452 [Gurleya vavrai]
MFKFCLFSVFCYCSLKDRQENYTNYKNKFSLEDSKIYIILRAKSTEKKDRKPEILDLKIDELTQNTYDKYKHMPTMVINFRNRTHYFKKELKLLIKPKIYYNHENNAFIKNEFISFMFITYSLLDFIDKKIDLVDYYYEFALINENDFLTCTNSSILFKFINDIDIYCFYNEPDTELFLHVNKNDEKLFIFKDFDINLTANSTIHYNKNDFNLTKVSQKNEKTEIINNYEVYLIKSTDFSHSDQAQYQITPLKDEEKVQKINVESLKTVIPIKGFSDYVLLKYPNFKITVKPSNNDQTRLIFKNHEIKFTKAVSIFITYTETPDEKIHKQNSEIIIINDRIYDIFDILSNNLTDNEVEFDLEYIKVTDNVDFYMTNTCFEKNSFFYLQTNINKHVQVYLQPKENKSYNFRPLLFNFDKLDNDKNLELVTTSSKINAKNNRKKIKSEVFDGNYTKPTTRSDTRKKLNA